MARQSDSSFVLVLHHQPASGLDSHDPLELLLCCHWSHGRLAHQFSASVLLFHSTFTVFPSYHFLKTFFFAIIAPFALVSNGTKSFVLSNLRSIFIFALEEKTHFRVRAMLNDFSQGGDLLVLCLEPVRVACAKQQILFRVQDLTVVIVPQITIWNPAHGIILFVLVSFDVRLITPPFYPGSLTAHSFPIRRISSWRALVSHVRRYDKRIFFNMHFSHRGLWALHLQLVDNISLSVYEGD